MSKFRNRLINSVQDNPFRQNSYGSTLSLLKKAWDDLPADFSINERSLFIEIAERLIKVDPGETN
jgi:hypothetical protein